MNQHPSFDALPPAFHSVRAAVDALPHSEMVAIAEEMRTMTSADERSARALLHQYPTLTAALLMMEERLGMLHTWPPASTIDIDGSSFDGKARAVAGVSEEDASMGSSTTSSTAMQTSQLGINKADALSSSNSSSSSMSSSATSSDAAAVASSSAPEDEAVTMIRSILAMSQSDVSSVPAEQREMVNLVRDAVLLPLKAIQELPPARRSELLVYREQLQQTMGIIPTP